MEFNLFLENNLKSNKLLKEYMEMENYLNEAYYGKNKDLIKCEELFESLKKRAYKLSFSNIANLEESKQIEEILRKQFNFNSFRIGYTADGMINVFSIPIQLTNTKRDPDFYKLSQAKEGIKYKNSDKKELLMFITQGALSQLSGAELVAITLHEIGHNFYVEKDLTDGYICRQICFSVLQRVLSIIDSLVLSIYSPENVVNLIMNFGYIFVDIFFVTNRKASFAILKFLQGNALIQNIQKIYENIDRIKFFNILNKFMTTLYQVCFGAPVSILSWIASSIYMLINQLLNSAIDKVLSDGYTNEKFADNFATSYGYGPEVAQLFSDPTKFDRTRLKWDKVPVLNVISEVNIELARALSGLGDAHPSDFNRVEMTEAKLKHELYNNKQYLTKEQIKSIENEIELIQKVKDNTPLFRKAIRGAFADMKMGEIWDNHSDKEIFDFDKTFLKDNLKEY